MKTFFRLMQSSCYQIESALTTLTPPQHLQTRVPRNQNPDDLLMKHVTRNGTATEYIAFKKYL